MKFNQPKEQEVTLSVGSVLEAMEVGEDVRLNDLGEMTDFEFYVKWGLRPDQFEVIRVDLPS